MKKSLLRSILCLLLVVAVLPLPVSAAQPQYIAQEILEGNPENGQPAAAGTNGFTDVADGTWYTEAVMWAYENGIVEGYGNGQFRPNNELSREQLAAILYRYADYKGYDVTGGAAENLEGFTDRGEVSSWAVDSMQWAVAKQIIQGNGNGTLTLKGTAKRCEMAQMICRFLEAEA